MGSMRLIYFGSPAESAHTLKALVEAGHKIEMVITAHDKPRGRGQNLSPTPVKMAAQELGLRVSHNPNDAVQTSAELGIVVAFGRLIKEPVLNAFELLNIHFSLLPKWRGAAPVERAILAGDKKTGVCLMRLEAALDTGPVYDKVELEIQNSDTTQSLKEKLVKAGTRLLLENLESGLSEPKAQKGEASWAEKVEAKELALNPQENADLLVRKIRAGGAWLSLSDTKRLKVLDAKAGPKLDGVEPGQIVMQDKSAVFAAAESSLSLIEVVPDGRKKMSGAAWLRGIKRN